MRVLVFGDSITQGFWDSEGGWVARLRKHYDQLAIQDLHVQDNQPVIFNLGISGGTSETILQRFDNETKARQSSEMAFVFSTGLNDSYREGADKFRSTPQQYEQNLQNLVAAAKKYSDRILFVGLVAGDETKTMPVFWRDIYYQQERIKQFEDLMKKVADSNNLAFVPIFEEFKKRGEKLYEDGLHPNNQGHQLIFELVRPQLNKLVKFK